MYLPFHNLWIQAGSKIVDGGIGDYLHLTGFTVNLDFARVTSVGEAGCWGAMEQLWNWFHNWSVAPQTPTSGFAYFEKSRGE